MPYLATISSKGQMVIPAELRKELGLKAGVQVTVTRNGRELVITPRDFEAVFALCGVYAGMGMEETLMENKRAEREREDRKLEAF